MTNAQRSALGAFASGALAEVIINTAFTWSRPAIVSFGIGVGYAVTILVMGQKADKHPFWQGVMMPITGGLGVVVARLVWGDSCPI